MKTLQEMYIEEVRDVYDAENQVLKALEKMEAGATNSRLAQGFRTHRTETEGHIKRLETIFKNHDEPVKGKTCKGMKGLITEADEHMSDAKDTEVRDAVLIAGAQKVEHYEICAYGTLRTLATQLGYTKDVELLTKTLDEEYATDKKLTALAEGSGASAGLNEKAIAGTNSRK